MSEKRIVLITGANKGLGLQAARELGAAGLTVLLGSRDAQRGSETAAKLRGEGHDAREIAIDLEDGDTLRAAAERVEQEFGHLDVLINNAGINVPGDGAASTADLAAIRRLFETNFFGTVAVTQAMLPLLRKGSSARIVNVSSELGSIRGNGDPDWKYAAVKLLGYNSSKAALNMMTAQLSVELRDAGIKVNSANPGYTATDLNAHSGPQTVEEGAEIIVRLALAPDDGPTGGFFEREGPLDW